MDLTENMIECTIKRKGGSEVPMGHHKAKQVTYHFKPIDPNDPTSPHVCDVPDEDHYARFLSIRESYRRYKVGAAPAEQLPAPDDESEVESLKNDMDDILSIENVETLSNEWLEKYSREKLDVSFTAKKALIDLAVDYGIEDLTTKDASSRIVKEILKVQIEEAQRGSDAFAAGDQT